MAEYKRVLSGYINDSKNGDGKYLTITNTSDEVITLKPGDKLFLNATPEEILAKNPKVPHFSKSIKVEGQSSSAPAAQASLPEVEDVTEDIPF